MKLNYYVLILLCFGNYLNAQETDNFPPPETPIEVKATKVNSKI
ncbi:hypothetical protein FBALC1_11627 [Flavobacteriales bacterium ALC-1]|nr:hypothetical protein FBALC1_11627 [Flavobacteriales bacterium ALC-1]